MLITSAVSQLQAASVALNSRQNVVQALVATLSEYPVVMQMVGVDQILRPQLMAEIGDVRRFHSKKPLVTFAGIDAPYH